jgi:tetratricopeptide (TPR) repeat protein
MMKYIIIPGILLLMICNLTTLLSAQDFKETIKFADSQFSLGNYQLAVKEYQRALFFGKNDSSDYLYKKIAHAFFKNQKFDQANYFYDLSYKTATNDSLKKELIFNKTQCYMLLGDFQKSIYELTGLGNDLSEYFRNKRDFYFAITYFGLEDFEQSKIYFISLTNKKPEAKQEIEKIFKSKKNLYRPNPKTAKTLSMIVPGSGQLYAGDIKNSINSIVLIGGIAILGLRVYNEYSLFDTFMSVFPWFTRYYQGGYNKAFDIAVKKRAIRRNKTYKQILKVIGNS